MCDGRETCTVTWVATPARPEFPWRVRCSRCGWIDHFDTERVAGLWAWRHDHTHESGSAVTDALDAAPYRGLRPDSAHSPSPRKDSE